MNEIEEQKARRAVQAPVLRELVGGLWHTTHPTRFQSILKAGAVLPEPDIPEKDRWGTSQGPDLYPYVRSLGGVSLFDFHDFDPADYSQQYPMSSWHEFVPYRPLWKCAVWIEIDRKKSAEHFISGIDLLTRQKAEGAYRHRVMPRIETAHIGALPTSAFKRAFLADADGVRDLDILTGHPLPGPDSAT